MSVNSYEFTARQWADFVGKLLIKGNWNQSALCRELNRVVPEKNQISASTVGNWVREEDSGVEPSMPSIESMGRVAKLLQIPLCQLVEAVQKGEDPSIPDLSEAVIPALQQLLRSSPTDKNKLIAALRAEMDRADLSLAANTLLLAAQSS
jgi:transcriptional regulator with XRE-family HTH domain